MAIAYSCISIEIREVLLSDKPSSMLEYSPKASVPVLVLSNGQVIDESLDIIMWALAQYDPDKWMPNIELLENYALPLISENDNEFKNALDLYKYSSRHPDHDQVYYRQQGEIFLQKLEDKLQQHKFLLNENISLVDVAIMPFIRQFALVDLPWFESSRYQSLLFWLKGFMDAAVFLSVMQKYPQWQEGEAGIICPA